MKVLIKQTVSFSGCLLLAVVLAACSGDSTQSSSQSSDDRALDKDTNMAYVQRSVDQSSTANRTQFDQARMSDGQTPLELYSPYRFNPGARLIERSGLDVDAVTRELLSSYFGSSAYDVKDLNTSEDGRYLLFAAHGPIDHPTDYTWNIYEYDFIEKNLRRVIADNALANAGQDTNPTYTLEGDIIFSSDRAAGNPNSPVINIVPVEDEEYCYKITPEHNPSLLHSMTREGADILQLTYGNNHDTNPTTLADGRVAFVRWTYTYEVINECEMPLSRSASSDQLLRATADSPWGLRRPDQWSVSTQCEYSESTPVARVIAKNHYTLLSITADGTDIDQLYKTVSIDASEEEFVVLDRILQNENGQFTVILKHKFNDKLGGELLALGSPESASESKVFGNMAPRSLIAGDSGLYPGQLSKKGWYSAVWPYYDGSSRLLVSWSQCLVTQNGVSRFCENVVGEGDDSKYGLWLYDPDSQSRAPVVKANRDVVFEDVVLSRAHNRADFPYTPYNPDYVDNLDDAQVICNYPPPVNNAPVANAGADQSVTTGSNVQLDGSASSDVDGDTLTYYWQLVSQPSGSVAALDGSTSVQPSFTADRDGTYQFQLVVNDGELDSVADMVSVIASTAVSNYPPVANAGSDQQVLVGAVVNLDGSGSSDPDGGALTYQWQVIAPAGVSNTIFSDATSSTPSFTAAIEGSYTLQLVVSDGQLTSAPDNVTVDVAYPNRAPLAEAGNNQQVSLGSTVQLNGSGSSDPDGDSLSYQWTVISPAGASLVNANTVMPSITVTEYGTYTIQLVVSDGQLNSTPDTVAIEVTNSKPIANAGDDVTVESGQSVVLDGSGSYDPEGSSLSYSWVLTSSPSGSSANLLNSDTANPVMTPDIDGQYTLQLIVNDGLLNSNPDSVTVTVAAANRAPIADAGDDQQVTLGGTYQLDGTGSTDADGDSLTYQWTVISPVDALLSSSNIPRPTIAISEYGNYVIQLIVNDGQVDSQPDEVLLSFDNIKPIANAGPDQSVKVNTDINLDGSASSDINGDPLTYSWTIISQPAGSSPALTNPQSVTPTFNADVQGQYQIQLIVNDGALDSEPDTLLITAPNTAPVANAGLDAAVTLGTSPQLNGSNSYDVDGDPLTYQWSLLSVPSGSGVSLLNPTNVMPTLQNVDSYGDYIIQLIVNDGLEDSQPDTVVLSTQNLPPVADAGEDLLTEPDQIIALDGSSSLDPEGQSLSYQWSIISSPQGSVSDLDSTTVAAPGFTADTKGDYVLQLIVNDGVLSSAPDTVVVTVKNLIDEPEVIESCENLPKQSTSIILTFPSTRYSYSAGSEGRCNWQYTEHKGLNYIQGYYQQTVNASLPENAIVCNSSLIANSGSELEWNYDDEFYLTLGNHVLVSSEKASVMEYLVTPDAALPYGEGPYEFDFGNILDLAYSHSYERYCLGNVRNWDINDASQYNSQCDFPRTQNVGPFNIVIPQEAFAGVSADIVNSGSAEFSLIVTGDNDNKIDCQHTGIELNWRIQYVVPTNN